MILMLQDAFSVIFDHCHQPLFCYNVVEFVGVMCVIAINIEISVLSLFLYIVNHSDISKNSLISDLL